jgi:hypothetical protein
MFGKADSTAVGALALVGAYVVVKKGYQLIRYAGTDKK